MQPTAQVKKWSQTLPFYLVNPLRVTAKCTVFKLITFWTNEKIETSRETFKFKNITDSWDISEKFG